MKKIILLFLVIFLLSACSAIDTFKNTGDTTENAAETESTGGNPKDSQETTLPQDVSSHGGTGQTNSTGTTERPQTATEKQENPQNTGKIDYKGVWISYLELNFEGMSKKEFENSVDIMYNNLEKANINTVFVHVRPFCDALYKSDYFPYCAFLTGTQGKDPGFDPLDYMIQAAHKRKISFHAWINPYRVLQSSNDLNKLSDNNPAKKFLTDKNSENDDCVVVLENGIYLNPARKEVKELILNGIREIVNRYEIDGIHFDDYFYPTTSASFDEKSYQKYLSAGGRLTLGDWRRVNVDSLISSVYRTVKSMNKNVEFGISPAANLEKNYNEYYADIEKWVKNDGYVDYICPQLYFGFLHPTEPFKDSLLKWHTLTKGTKVKLLAGLAAYKAAKAETYVSNEFPEAKSEWVKNSDILKRQLECIKGIDNIKGFVLYSYSSFFSDEVKTERENFLKILK